MHSSLRNVIESCFKVLKARFPILKFMRSYSFRKQTQIVIACCAIHNFITMYAQGDQLFNEYEEFNTEVAPADGLARTELNTSVAHLREMAEKRDAFANQMWNDQQSI
ncbi:hypothetical protein LINGRAHAP2_LOCUS31019 [Linum grandiflorum]